MLFETERLVVRELLEADVDAMYAIYGDAAAMRWVGDSRPLTREQCVRWLEVTRKNYKILGYGMAALALRGSGAVAGFCGIVHPGGQPQAEIKYALLRQYRGQGLATEAVKAMLAYGWRTFGLSEIIATLDPRNFASHR